MFGRGGGFFLRKLDMWVSCILYVWWLGVE